MNGRSLHRTSTLLLSLSMGVIGVALLLEGLLAHPLAVTRLLLGVLFVAAAAGRLYLQRRSRGHT
jgi:hypothetical protein